MNECCLTKDLFLLETYTFCTFFHLYLYINLLKKWKKEHIYNYCCDGDACSVRDIWKNGLLWNIIKLDIVSDKEASPRHCDIFQQCDKLGWHYLDNSYLRSLHCRCSSWSLLDFRHCLSCLLTGIYASVVFFINC